MITVKFISSFDNYKPGDVAQIERTLALRLMGIGKAQRIVKEPVFKKPVRTGARVEPVKEPEVKTEEKAEPEKPKKKKPGRPKKKKIERAIEID